MQLIVKVAIMNKKIIILNGSPRLKGNTAGLIDAFVQGAEQTGHTVKTFNLQKMNIHPCLGCLGGGKNPDSPCTQKDDMDQIYPVYEEADIVVLASPMYYWSITAQLKAAFDRLFAVAEKDGDYRNQKKECIMLMAAEGDTRDNFEPVEHYYHALLKHLEWKNAGEVYAGGVMKIGDIKGHPALDEARQLGLSIQ
ncbi:flavodoxin family protein [Parabacteroides faecis]|nr:flavodoxin family protein [Parabacteroides faecis]